MPQMERKCQHCEFFQGIGDALGRCYRYPPTLPPPHKDDGLDACNHMPLVVAYSWCGEFQKANGIASFRLDSNILLPPDGAGSKFCKNGEGLFMDNKKDTQPGFQVDVNDIGGADLDYLVAKAVFFNRNEEGVITWEFPTEIINHSQSSACWVTFPDKKMLYSPSTEWVLAGPIIERERIMICSCTKPEDGWTAFHGSPTDTEYKEGGRGWFNGDTPLLAAMRAYVASVFGPEVPSQWLGY